MIGKGIREVRKQNDLSITELAKKLKMSKYHLSNIELGYVTPSLKLINKIAKTLKTHPVVLFWNGVDETELKKDKRSLLPVFKNSVDSVFEKLF